MEEFGLEEARLSGEDWLIEFSRNGPQPEVVTLTGGIPSALDEPATRPKAAKKSPATPAGVPVTSPMTGIYYGSPSPGAAPFVTEGSSVSAGQVVGLIEAMKVFNEITAATSGTVSKIVASNGQLVNPGEPLLYIV